MALGLQKLWSTFETVEVPKVVVFGLARAAQLGLVIRRAGLLDISSVELSDCVFQTARGKRFYQILGSYLIFGGFASLGLQEVISDHS